MDNTLKVLIIIFMSLITWILWWFLKGVISVFTNSVESYYQLWFWIWIFHTLVSILITVYFIK